jgi:uncharacterized protein DUF5947
VSETEQPREHSEAFGFLRQFVRRKETVEACELCSAPLTLAHQHLLEPATRKLVCACDACVILFSNQGARRFKRVPRRVRALTDFQLTEGQWDSLMMPINMAFFFESSPQGKVIALYPSPAGATESLLPLDAWEDIASENPALRKMVSDVEALLVNRLGHSRGFSNPEYYIVPIDECFKLVGLIRGNWRGLSGGTEVWQQMARFFADLKQKAQYA